MYVCMYHELKLLIDIKIAPPDVESQALQCIKHYFKQLIEMIKEKYFNFETAFSNKYFFECKNENVAHTPKYIYCH